MGTSKRLIKSLLVLIPLSLLLSQCNSNDNCMCKCVGEENVKKLREAYRSIRAAPYDVCNIMLVMVYNQSAIEAFHACANNKKVVEEMLSEAKPEDRIVQSYEDSLVHKIQLYSKLLKAGCNDVYLFSKAELDYTAFPVISRDNLINEGCNPYLVDQYLMFLDTQTNTTYPQF